MPAASDTERLGSAPIGRLILAFSGPSIVSTALTSISAIISAIFIGYCVGGIAIASMAVTFPLINLIMAVSLLLGSGGATLCSIYLGKDDPDTARAAMGHVAVMSFAGGLVFGLGVQPFLEDLLFLFGASENTLGGAMDYMRIMCALLFFQYPMMAMISLMRASGYPHKSMIIAMMNVAFTVLFLFLFVWYLEWGMAGAALASAVGHVPALVFILVHFTSEKHTVHFTRDCFRFRPALAKRILQIGLPPFLMNCCSCVIAILINQTLLHFGGDLAIAAYGIVNRIIMLAGMIVMGVNLGTQPVIGYNWGAQNYDRVRGAVRISVLISTSIMTAAFVFMELWPGVMVRMFTNEADLIELAEHCLRIFILLSSLVGIQMPLVNYFMSIGEAFIGGVLGLTRQLIFVLPFLIVLPRYFGLDGVFYTIPAADLCSFVTTAGMYLFYQRKHKPCFEEGIECPPPKF